MSWLFSVCNEEKHSQVIDCTFSHEIWVRLTHNYNATTKSRLIQLKTDLIHLNKSSDSMLVFFNKARSISYHLAQIDRAIPDEDLVFHILQGLPTEFNAFKTAISTQQLKNDNLVTSSELLGLLLSEEARINSESKVDFTTASTNVSTHQSSPYSSFDST